MPTIISLINLKGGVAKTTSAVALAEFLAARHGKRVLLVDLDPQASASFGFITPNQFGTLKEQGKTLTNLFQDHLATTTHFNLDEAIQKNVSKIEPERTTGRVDLLTTGIDMVKIQDAIPQILVATRFATNPIHILRSVIAPTSSRYDFILIDCPPNLGALTLNAILISHFYIVPTIADTLSTFGLPPLIHYINTFKASHPDCTIQLMGILVTLYTPQGGDQNTELANLRSNQAYTRVFKEPIPKSINAARAFNQAPNRHSLKQRFPGSVGDAYHSFALEVMKYANQRS
jgi:chromosome partitioning protein